MRCIHCGQPLPEDSKFCQYCGEKIAPEKAQSSGETAVTEEEMAMDIAAEEKPAAVNETRENPNAEPPIPTPVSNQKHRTEKKSRSKASAVIPWVLFLLTAICAAVLLRHAVQMQDQSEAQQTKIAELQTQIDDLESTIDAQASEIGMQEDYAEMKEKADMFDLLSSWLKSDKDYVGTENFHVKEGVVVLSKGTTKTLELTTRWTDKAGRVEVYSSNNCCRTDFVQDYSGTRKISIQGKSPGVSVATVYNSENTDKVKILIIVTE